MTVGTCSASPATSAPMTRNLLVCGLVAGILGGLLAAALASVVAEPVVDRAIAFEDSGGAETHAHDSDASPARVQAPAPVSRGLQKSAGLLTALVVYGLSLGGLFAIAFALAYGRLGIKSPRATAYRLALGAFVVVYLVPFVKYPANPPAVGDPTTIGTRTLLYVTVVAISLLAALAAARLRLLLARRVTADAAAGLALASYLVIVVAAGVSLPSVNEVPADFPATTLWEFRQASIGLQITLWATIAIVFGFAAERVMTGRSVIGLGARVQAGRLRER
jgi:predicted cobalt transporter CbtA